MSRRKRRDWWLIACTLLLAVAGAVYLGRPAAAPAASTSRLTRAPYIQWTTQTSAYILWHTGREEFSRVEYWREGPGTPLGSPSSTKSGTGPPTRRHTVWLSGLLPGQHYSYRVGSANSWHAQGQFATAPKTGKPFRFAVWGDSGTGSDGQHALAGQIERGRPDFLLHTGDLIYNRGEAERYDRYFFSVYKGLLARAPFYGSLGNHDVLTEGGRPLLDNFVLPPNGPAGLTPERNYSFDFGDAHVVVIDSNLSESRLKRQVVPWLESDLRRSKAIWKFAAFHHPPYSSSMHGDEPRTQRALAPALARLGVDAVFNGHDHAYERFKPRDGVVYVVTGAGGAGRYRRREHRAATARYFNSDWSFTLIEIDGRVLRGQQISARGAGIDDWSLRK